MIKTKVLKLQKTLKVCVMAPSKHKLGTGVRALKNATHIDRGVERIHMLRTVVKEQAAEYSTAKSTNFVHKPTPTIVFVPNRT